MLSRHGADIARDSSKIGQLFDEWVSDQLDRNTDANADSDTANEDPELGNPPITFIVLVLNIRTDPHVGDDPISDGSTPEPATPSRFRSQSVDSFSESSDDGLQAGLDVMEGAQSNLLPGERALMPARAL